jgi:hypothetical protein
MRGVLAAAILFSHCAGLLGAVIIVTLLSSDPTLGGVVETFLIGLMLSTVAFVPIALIASLYPAAVLWHRLLFVLFGPVIVTGLWWMIIGHEVWEAVALSTGIASLVMFLLQRSQGFARRVPAD